jgi:hypothetical protein
MAHPYTYIHIDTAAVILSICPPVRSAKAGSAAPNLHASTRQHRKSVLQYFEAHPD